MSAREALERAQDRIRILRDAERLDADRQNDRQFCSARERAKGLTDAIAVLHLMLAQPDCTITQNQISEARSRAISPANTPRRKGVR